MTLNELQFIIDGLNERIESLEKISFGAVDRVTDLEKVLYDEILNPVKAAYDEQLRVDNINGFRERNPSLQDFDADLRVIEGEDFDVYTQAYDGFNEMNGQMEEAEFVAELTASIGEQLNQIKEKLGVAGEVTATLDEDGQVDVETVEEKPAEGEKPAEEEKVDEESAISEEDEIKAFEEELIKALA